MRGLPSWVPSANYGDVARLSDYDADGLACGNRVVDHGVNWCWQA